MAPLVHSQASVNIALMGTAGNAKPQSLASPFAVDPRSDSSRSGLSADASPNVLSFPAIFDGLAGPSAGLKSPGSATARAGKKELRAPAPPLRTGSSLKGKGSGNPKLDASPLDRSEKLVSATMSGLGQSFGAAGLLAAPLSIPLAARSLPLVAESGGAAPTSVTTPLSPRSNLSSVASAHGSARDLAFVLQLTWQSRDSRTAAGINPELPTIGIEAEAISAQMDARSAESGVMSTEMSGRGGKREADPFGGVRGSHLAPQPAVEPIPGAPTSSDAGNSQAPLRTLETPPAPRSGPDAPEHVAITKVELLPAGARSLQIPSAAFAPRAEVSGSSISGPTTSGKTLRSQPAPDSNLQQPVGVQSDVTVDAGANDVPDTLIQRVAPAELRNSTSRWVSGAEKPKNSGGPLPAVFGFDSSANGGDPGSRTNMTAGESQRMSRGVESTAFTHPRGEGNAVAHSDNSGSEPLEPAPRPIDTQANVKGQSFAVSQKVAAPSGHDVMGSTTGAVWPQHSGALVPSGARGRQGPTPGPVTQDIGQAPLVRAAIPLREVSLRLAVATSAAATTNVDVQLAERAGKVQVAVRTGDQDLAKSLQGNLGELVGRLQDKGFKTEAWSPLATPHGGWALREAASSSTTRDQADHSGGQGAQPDSRRQQQSDQRRQGHWEMEWERTEHHEMV